MCMWAMEQGDEFFDQQLNEMRYGGGIWNMIASVLQVFFDGEIQCQPTPEQMKEILRSRRGTVQQQENVASVLAIVDQVQKRLQETLNSMKEQLEGIMNTLTPEQQIQFLQWSQNILREPNTLESILMTLKKRIEGSSDNKSNTSSLEDDV